MLLAAYAGTFDNDGFLATKNCFIMAPEMRFKTDTKQGAQRDLTERFASKAWPRAASVSLGAPRMPINLLHHDPQNRTRKVVKKGGYKGSRQ